MFEPNPPLLLVSTSAPTSTTYRSNTHSCYSFQNKLVQRLSSRESLTIPSFLSIQISYCYEHVAIVDCGGHTLLDCFVKPTPPISDYGTSVTGVLKQDLESNERGLFIFPDGTCPLTL